MMRQNAAVVSSSDLPTSDISSTVLMHKEESVETPPVNEDVQTDLVEACSQRDLNAFKFILYREGGHPFLRPNTTECSPFHTAAMVGCTEILKYILENCSRDQHVDVNQREGDCNKTALHFAATNGYVETVLYLLNAGADPDPLSFDLWTPMHYAAENGHEDVIVALLNNGANPDIKNQTSQTPAHLAAVYDHPKCFQVIVEHYGFRALKRQRKTAGVIRSLIPGLIPDMCKEISAYAIAPSDLDILDDWDRSPVDWAIETRNSKAGEGWDPNISKILLVASEQEQDAWFF